MVLSNTVVVHAVVAHSVADEAVVAHVVAYAPDVALLLLLPLSSSASSDDASAWSPDDPSSVHLVPFGSRIQLQP